MNKKEAGSLPSQITNYQCPACTGPLHFVGSSGRLECEYCGSSYSVQEIEALYADKEEAAEAAGVQAQSAEAAQAAEEYSFQQGAEGLKVYSCPSCGAELFCDETTAATSCPYCGNPTVVPSQFHGQRKPDFVLPFKLDKAAAVAAEVTPALSVSPAVSVIAVNVTNPGEGTVTVTDVRFRAPEAIVGSFTVDVTGDSPVFTAVSASDEAALTVQGGAVLKKEESAVFYLAVKPFVAGAGTTLTLTVNEDVRTITLTRPVTFSAGKIKTLNFTLEPSDPDPVGTFYFKRVSSFSPGKKYILVAAETDDEGNETLRMAQAMPAETASGRLYCEDVEEEDGIITLSSQENAFTFYESENGTLIRQADGRYLYNNNSNANVYAGTEPAIGYYWTITFDNQDLASIVNRQRQLKYNATSSVRAFQTRKTTESGLPVRLYELQNSDDAVAEFIQHTTPGVYAYEGSDWLYVDGSMQLSVRTGNGETAFRIYEPSTYTVIQVTGIPEAIAENDRLDIRLARYVKQAATHFSDLSVQVVHIEDGKAWLMAGNGTGFIVCIQ